MKKLYAAAFLILLLTGCSGTQQLKRNITPDDSVVFGLLDRLKKNAGDKEAAELLPNAYRAAAATRKEINSNNYNNLPPGDRWLKIIDELRVMEKMYLSINSIPAAKAVVPNPWNPSAKMADAKEKAVEEFYMQGQQYLHYNNRSYAQKAYNAFSKAADLDPGYKDLPAKLAEASEMATIKVVVEPVNYHQFNWSYWGYSNDWLQQQMVMDLNRSAYAHTKFFTSQEARSFHLPIDRVVSLQFDQLYIGTVNNRNYTIERSAHVQVGQTKSIPAKPVYTTVKATVYVQQRILQSNASLTCRIYKNPGGQMILQDRFPANDLWKQEQATFRGDRRALQPADLQLINNRIDDRPPSQKDIAQRLIRDSYQLLMIRIKNGISFE